MNYAFIIGHIIELDESARTEAVRAVNRLLTLRNWLIGAYIVEFEQCGEDRAAYGARLMPTLAADLKKRGASGLSLSTLKNFRQFALTYPQLGKSQTLFGFFDVVANDRRTLPSKKGKATQSAPPFPSMEQRAIQQPTLPWQDQRHLEHLLQQLSWSHFLQLIRLDDSLKRAFYELECLSSRWSVRELERQIDSMLYERAGLSKDKAAVMALAQHGKLTATPASLVRDPYILEFLGLPEKPSYTESELEEALLSHLQKFLLELGREFCFIARQLRITVGRRHNYLDLLFFHRRLRCLVAVELKMGAFRHENAGQMNFYLNYIKEHIALPDENPPVGILLCADRDAGEVHYATAGLDQQLFVSRYRVALPTEEQLRQWLLREQEELGLLHGDETLDNRLNP